MSLEDLVLALLKRWELLIVAAYWLYWLYGKIKAAITDAGGESVQALPEVSQAANAQEQPRRPAPPPRPAAPPPRKAAPDAVQRLIDAAAAFEQQARALSDEVEREPANRRFVGVLREWIPARCAEIREALQRVQGPMDLSLIRAMNALELVLAEIKDLVSQRRNPELRGQLGDADRLADACYQPVITFARAEGLPLATAYPATQLAPLDLAIWTGFAPTQIAPIFLPPGFFESLIFWPALAHEVGHDFFISVRGLDQSLRRELSLDTEENGTRALYLRPDGSGLDAAELRRIFGGWLEEIFADVFGTLMCGPAYVKTMSMVFGAREDAREVLAVGRDPGTGRYDVHPPGHVRVHVGRVVLERAGLHEDAGRLWNGWMTRHGFSPDEPPPLLFPMQDRYLAIRFQPMAEIATELVERLYSGPLEGLNGFGLSDISGLDYGPSEHFEARRARDAFLGGQVPAVRDARRVIAGAVLACVEKPELEEQIRARAREAIPALGTYEQAPDAYRPSAPVPAAPLTSAGPLEVAPGDVLEALLLREVLRRPARQLRRGRPGGRP